MPPPLVVGLQSGRGFGESVRLLKEHGFSEPVFLSNSPRCLAFRPGTAPASLGSRPVRYVPVKPRDVAGFLLHGLVDVVACFDDAFGHLEDKKYQLKPLAEFVSAAGPEFEVKPRLAICGRPGLDLTDTTNRIVAEYEDGARLMERAGVKGSVFYATGGSEGAICAGLADVGLMVVQSGTTLRENGLTVYQELREIKMNLWCNTDTGPGLEAYAAMGPRDGAVVRLGGPDEATVDVVARLNALADLRKAVVRAVPLDEARRGVDALSTVPGVARLSFLLTDGRPGQPLLDQEWQTWAGNVGATVLDLTEGAGAVVDAVCAAVQARPQDGVAGADAAGASPAKAIFDPPPRTSVDVDTLTEEEFLALPLVIKGESKEVRYAGRGLVVIRFLPTIYSYTQNRAAVVEGSDRMRLDADRIFVELFRRSGVEHAYMKVTDRWVLGKLVLPHAAEYAKYGLPPFVPPDMSEAEIRSLPRAPPIEIIIKTFHGGTSKHRYVGMEDTRVRASCPRFPGARIRVDRPYPAPFIRFDWRNPLTMVNASTLKAPDPGSKAACEAFLEQLPAYRDRFGSSFAHQQLEEYLKTSIDPATKRVPDEILPEALAEHFIDVSRARQTALNVYHVMQSFLDTCDIVCNDLCLFITEDGSMVYGEISQDCGRFRHFDLGSLDKDVWRTGGSSSQVLEKWAELSRLLDASWQQAPKLELAVPPPSAPRLELFIGTGNPYKVAEIASILQHMNVALTPMEPQEVDEPYDTFQGNARAKALAYAEMSGGLTLAEDSGISVDALGGLPGPRAARFSDFACVDVASGTLSGYEESGRSRDDIDRANNAKLMDLMEGRAERTAAFHVCFSLALKGRILFEAFGESRGEIAEVPRGTEGFGYDPIFVGNDTGGLTYAELDPFRKNLRSHRRRALKKVAQFLVEAGLRLKA